MTREDARQNLIALGIEEPTDAVITNYLNQFHANKPTPALIPQPKIPEPTPQPVEPQVDNEEMEKLRKQIADLQADNIKKDIRAYASEKGLTGDSVATILSTFKDDFESAKTAIDSIVGIISEKEVAAANAKEQEIAKGAFNPGGGAGSNGNENKLADVENAKNITFGGVNSNAQAARDYYK